MVYRAFNIYKLRKHSSYDSFTRTRYAQHWDYSNLWNNKRDSCIIRVNASLQFWNQKLFAFLECCRFGQVIDLFDMNVV